MDSKTSLPFTSTCNRQSSLFEGTDVILDGISKDAIEEAKGTSSGIATSNNWKRLALGTYIGSPTANPPRSTSPD